MPHWHFCNTIRILKTFEATATVLRGEERDRLFAKQAELYPQFGEYQAKTTRTIPVIALERRKG